MAATDRPANLPDGLHSLSPHLVCDGAAEAIAFYEKAFGAVEMMRLPGPDGKLIHACVSICGSSVMLMDEQIGCGAQGPLSLGGSPVTIHLAVADADAVAAQAVEAGATLEMPVQEMFWGDRYGVLRDPFGHRWSVGTPVRNPTLEEIQEGMRAAFAEA